MISTNIGVNSTGYINMNIFVLICQSICYKASTSIYWEIKAGLSILDIISWNSINLWIYQDLAYNATQEQEEIVVNEVSDIEDILGVGGKRDRVEREEKFKIKRTIKMVGSD